MNFSNNRRLYIKRIIFALLIILTAVLQNTKGAIPQISGVCAMITVPLVVCIAMFEKSVAALLFGFFAGAMIDMTSITADGFFAAVLVIVAFAVSVLLIFYMRKNIFSCLLMSFIAILFVNTMYWLLFIVLMKVESPVYIYFRYYFPSVFYTFVFTPIYYYLVRFTAVKTAPERKHINY